jgi:hypothetical protein
MKVAVGGEITEAANAALCSAPLFRLFYQVEIRYSQLLQLTISQHIATTDLARLHRNYGVVVAQRRGSLVRQPALRRPARRRFRRCHEPIGSAEGRRIERPAGHPSRLV